MRIVLLVLVFVSITIAQQNPVYKNANAKIEDRVEDLLSRMSLEEKIKMLGGTGFATQPFEELGIPELKMTDGPLGVRWDESTAFAAGIGLAATWNPDLAFKIGSSIGRETLGKGRHVILGPCVNIARIPQGGRNFESFGEDPFLASKMAVDYIKGVQNAGAAACVKHFAVNNQEHERMFVDAKVSDRALNEIYFPAFKAAVQEADVLTVMCAYNKLNGPYCAENYDLLTAKLKNEWGFKGLVMSDWGAVHSDIPVAKNGLDLEMPTGEFLNIDNLLPALESGELEESKIDDMVRRILSVIFKLGLFEKETTEDESLIGSKENREASLEVALQGIVMLKNDNGILPIDKNKIKSIAVIGPNAGVARTGGGGSSMVSPDYSISPLQALKEKLGSSVQINFSQAIRFSGETAAIPVENLFVDKECTQHGLKAKYYVNEKFEGNPKVERIDSQIKCFWQGGSPVDGIGEDHFSVQWEGYLQAPKGGEYSLELSSDDGSRMFIDDELVIDNWGDHGLDTKSYEIKMEANEIHKIKVEFYENGGDATVILSWQLPGVNLMDEAISAAKNSDVALLFVGTTFRFESEGFDRPDLYLPDGQEELIKAVTEVNPNTVVILTTGSPVLMDSWIGKVNGMIETWFAGEYIGEAAAQVLFGEYNPSGKLPITFPKSWEDCSAYPTYKAMSGTTNYDDGIYVGYRHFDKKNIEPLFPFGFGLSYTKFAYGNLIVSREGDSFTVKFEMTNSGNIAGSETAQLYISAIDSKIDKPVKELKGFIKTELKPGETKSEVFKFHKSNLAYYDVNSKSWKVESGKYKVMVGSSSRDILLESEITVE
ncbi:MAG: glycoside hydrolase family 3 C-terminal domain-containing protein [bacterium]